jgi:hypothetical protein
MKLKIAFLKQVNSVLQFIMDTLTDSLPNVCDNACKSVAEGNESLIKLMDNVLCVVEKNSYKCLMVKVCKTIQDNGNVCYDLKFSDEEGNRQPVDFCLPIARNKLGTPKGYQNTILQVIAAILLQVKNNRATAAKVFSS